MKKTIGIIIILAISVMTASAWAGDLKIHTRTISQYAVSASASYTPWTINLSTLEGCASLQLEVAGDGEVEVEYAISNDGQTYTAPQNGSVILTGVMKSSGDGGNGVIFDSFDIEFGKYVRIGFNEVGGISPVTVNATLAVR